MTNPIRLPGSHELRSPSSSMVAGTSAKTMVATGSAAGVAGGGLRRVLVEERLADVKHGRPGFDGLVVSGPEKGMAVWGYDDQIVLRRPVRNDACPEEPAPFLADGLSPEAARRHGPPPRGGRRAR